MSHERRPEKPTLKNLRVVIKKTTHQDPYERLVRHLSIYFTWLFVRTSITANQVTVLQEFVGVAGAVALAMGRPSFVLLGVALLQIGYLLDVVDGEVARWRGMASHSGQYLDMIGHMIVIPCFFFGLGYGAWAVTGRQEALIAGFVSALFSLKLDFLALYSVIDTLMDRSLASETPPEIPPQVIVDQHKISTPSALRKWAEILLRYPWTMNILTVIAVINWYYPGPMVGGGRLPLTYFATIGFAIIHVGIRFWQVKRVMTGFGVEKTLQKIGKMAKL